MSPAGQLALALIERATAGPTAGIAAVAEREPLRTALAKLSPFDLHAIAAAVLELQERR